ncbi:hypothetical protein LA080_001302 [Diaporthe eres]|uniref:Uncharacterized protein n=1 Tax=Diaporthe vaccinii TaxID=105482 RepID=A0ABR4E6L0_9PEZI|nr:hypothetical protein LA080_001302 [Diaporthe eres]
MQFMTLVAFASAFSAAIAAPTSSEETHPSRIFKRKDCPSDFDSTGSCNGSSCQWGLVNYPCDIGSCVGPGGGDGSCCGWAPNGASKCPNGGW